MIVEITPRMIDTTILVTEGDLQHGRILDCYECPLARAIDRYLAPEYYAAVFPRFFAIRRRDDALMEYPTCFDLPPQARSLVYAIDARCRIHLPFKTTIPLPAHALRRTPRILPLP